MSISAVFFDAGNTLLACDPPVEHVYGRAFAEYGIDRPDHEVRQAIRETWLEIRRLRAQGIESFNGNGGETAFWRRFVSRIFSRLGGGPLPGSLFTSLVEHFKHPQHWSVFPEVPEVLEGLLASGYRLHVVSNWDSTLPALLQKLGLDGYFDSIIVSALIGSSKPDPGIFREALGRAGVPPQAALHVGDSYEEDFEGARAAGIHALLLDRDGLSPDFAGAISSLDEISVRLKGPL